ncbi:alginate lyase family protein [Priestia megaterium]|uniref:alginate lyase family protein n=1 Tax=Priestia megaterium TaxID=1404 RepID=UPI000BFBFD96|nr:alginate lyase family protein [Priestia megaterium]PGR03303.1 hypothetical protein COA23_21680 [Priestia megaterium]
MSFRKTFILASSVLLICLSIIWWKYSGFKENSYGVYSQSSLEHTKEMIENNKEPYILAYNQFIGLANDALKEEFNPIIFLRIPPVYENKKGHIDASRPLTKSAYQAYVLSLAWKLTGKKKYADKAKEILDGWASTNKLISHREDTPLVSSYGGVGLVNAALLLKEDKSWDQDEFRKWVEFTYLPAVEVARNTENNWADWGNLACLTSYIYLDKEEEFQKEINYTKHLINTQIGVDGEMLKEISRKENGMFYTYFALAPLTQSMFVIYNETEINLFDIKTLEGSKVKRALDYYYYFVENPDEWPHYQGSNLNKPLVKDPNIYWPVSLYDAMSGIYPKSSYSALITKQPILGGNMIEVGPHHMAWNFPTLIKPQLAR